MPETVPKLQQARCVADLGHALAIGCTRFTIFDKRILLPLPDHSRSAARGECERGPRFVRLLCRC